MANQLLYFPYINLPNTDWTIRSLLYYESISSIVPDEYFYQPEQNYEPYMLELLRANLVLPINPMQVLEHAYELVDPFINFVMRPTYKIELKRENFLAGRYGRINEQKFNSTLLYNLEQLGIASHESGYWYRVEKATANYLMSYLSNIIARKLDMLPTTDIPILHPFSTFSRSKVIDPRISFRRNEILKGIMPFPLNLKIRDLQHFKETQSDLLNRFKNVVENIALDLKYNNENLLNEKILELNYHKDDLTAKMTESRIGKIAFISVMGLVGASASLMESSTKTAIIGASASFISAVYSALNVENPEKVFDQTGMKYLALVEKKLRI